MNGSFDLPVESIAQDKKDLPGMKLQIEGSGLAGWGYKVWLDGQEMKGVKNLTLDMYNDGANEVSITFLVNEIDVSAEAMQSLWAIVKENKEATGGRPG